MAKISLTGYGQNQSAVPSSLTPDQRSSYAPPLSDAYERICANGVARLRKVDSKPEVRPAHGMRNRSADTAVKVPASTVRR